MAFQKKKVLKFQKKSKEAKNENWGNKNIFEFFFF